MSLSDHLSITTLREDRKSPGERVNRLEGEPIQALSQPLPFSMRIRNGLSLLLLLAAVAWFWQPLVSLFSLTQEQEHYSHKWVSPSSKSWPGAGNNDVVGCRPDGDSLLGEAVKQESASL